jgi:hypothetical protein
MSELEPPPFSICAVPFLEGANGVLTQPSSFPGVTGR